MQALSDEQRSDAFEKKIDEGFAEMRLEFREIRSEMRRKFKDLRAEFKAVRGEMRKDARDRRGEIAALRRSMIQLFCGLTVPMILGFVAILLQHHL